MEVPSRPLGPTQRTRVGQAPTGARCPPSRDGGGRRSGGPRAPPRGHRPRPLRSRRRQAERGWTEEDPVTPEEVPPETGASGDSFTSPNTPIREAGALPPSRRGRPVGVGPFLEPVGLRARLRARWARPPLLGTEPHRRRGLPLRGEQTAAVDKGTPEGRARDGTGPRRRGCRPLHPLGGRRRHRPHLGADGELSQRGHWARLPGDRAPNHTAPPRRDRAGAVPRPHPGGSLRAGGASSQRDSEPPPSLRELTRHRWGRATPHTT